MMKYDPRVDEFLARRQLGRLASVSPQGQPHVVPVWYLWEEGAIWISSYESTRKIRHLRQQPRAALCVDTEQAQGGLTGVVLEGAVTLLREPRAEVLGRIERIYLRYLGPQGILEADPQSWLASPENLLIRLVPERISAW